MSHDVVPSCATVRTTTGGLNEVKKAGDVPLKRGSVVFFP